MIEYVAQNHPSRTKMIPDDPNAALQARMWDEFYDDYVGLPMQKIVGDRLRPEGRRDPHGVEEAQRALTKAYQIIERQLADKTWAIGDTKAVSQIFPEGALSASFTPTRWSRAASRRCRRRRG